MQDISMHNGSDERFMKIALNRAKRNLGNVAPNPSVGCVVVKDGVIIGAANTGIGGRPHAETLALEQAGSEAQGAEMYVTMEPCVHHGDTPPCIDAIIKAGIRKVLVAIRDPDPRINGKGLEKLQNAGIKVTLGTCADQAFQLNAGFIYSKTKYRPMITLKIACTIDGKIADFNGHSKWITDQPARNYANRLRATHDAIMVGCNTVLKDDPLLNCRLPGMSNLSPIRIVMDGNNRLITQHRIAPLRILSLPGKNWIVTASKVPPIEDIKGECSIEQIEATCSGPKNLIDIKDALHKIASKGVTRLLVEGGQKLIGSFLRHDLVDQLIIIRAASIAGSAAMDGAELNLELPNFKRFALQKSTHLAEATIETYVHNPSIQ